MLFLPPHPSPTFHSIPFPFSSTTPKNHLLHLSPIAFSPNPNPPPIKAPTPPWITSHDLIPNHNTTNNNFNNADLQQTHSDDKALTAKEIGVRGGKAINKILQTIQKLHHKTHNHKIDKHIARTDAQMGVNLEVLERGGDFRSRDRGRVPWERDERIEFRRRRKKEKVASKAELTLDKALLWRLRSEAVRMRNWVKVKKAGVTQDVVHEIRRVWMRSELAMVKFDIPLCRNMERAHEIVEFKTGGLVIWSKKDTLVIYRGHNHQITPKVSGKIYTKYLYSQNANHHGINLLHSETKNDFIIATDIHNKEDENFQPVSGSLFERETDRLLDALGPRFVDWWMHKPLPVDGDLLPEVVPGFQPPFRLSPPYTRSKLTDDELTYLRKLAQPLPVHFVLGRNRRLQGLATAILKLWEKSLIAKIAVKYGVPNTDNEKMANELKLLTGGILLLRNKFYIILYRGKDFLPTRVTALVEKREEELKGCQIHEEVTRLKAVEAFSPINELQQKTSTSGTLSEFKKIQSTIWDANNIHADLNVQLEAEKVGLEQELKKAERQLFILNKKIENSTKELLKLNAAWTPSEKDADLEIMSEEERQCFRKIGLKIRSRLVLGRRGIFDGVMEGMHQHWKHREVVKIITMQRALEQVINTATSLEAESGGVLVSVDKLKEGHAIIIYRGKNYRRPSEKGIKNLLTKREALHRSIEMQRLGSLKYFANQRQQRISDLKSKLAYIRQRKEVGQMDEES